MAQPWGAAAGAAGWAAGVAATLEAASHGLHPPGSVEPAAVAAAAAAAATATGAAGSLTPWGDPLSPTELGALVSQWQGAPTQAQPPAASQRWRCLDRAHSPACSRFELVGESGKKNGEKKLRSLLAITAEWNSAAERLTTAVAAERAGMPELGAALRAKRCACLRKKHFLYLCEAWRYRSDVWARKGGNKRRAPAADVAPCEGVGEVPRQLSQRRRVAPRAADDDGSPSPPPPRAPLPPRFATLPPALAAQRGITGGGALPLPQPAQPEGAWMIVASQLRPLSLEAAQLLWGEQARAAASTPGATAAVCRASLDALAVTRRALGDVALFVGTMHSATIAAFMQLPPPGAPEVGVAPGARSGCELYLSSRLLPWLRRAMAVHAARAAVPGASTPLLTWLGELHRACALLAAAADHAAAMLRSARVPGASLSVALKVECIALEWLAATACSAHAALLRRESWMAALLEAGDAAGRPPPQQPLMTAEELPRPGELVPPEAVVLWRREASGGAGPSRMQQQHQGQALSFVPDGLFADEG